MHLRSWAKNSAAFFLIASAFSQPASNPRAQIELGQGIAQFKSGKYKDAAIHLRKALRLDGESPQARLYLARALTEQFDASLKTPKNLALATEAQQQFEELLKRQPGNVEALKGFAKLKQETGDTEGARQYYTEAIAADSKDAEAHTALGTLDYARTIGKMNSSPASNYPPSAIDHPLCKVLRAESLPALDAAIDELKKAVDLHQQNGTAAYYLSLAYGARTRLDCGDPKARDADSKESAAWLERSMKWPSYPDEPVVYASATI
jgi:tetratricopeptide (TPR) repeat protein